MTDDLDVSELLRTVGFDAAHSVLTDRQAQVLAMRERDFTQAAIADRLGTSRANIASIEASARENVEKARETVEFVHALRAPAQVSILEGTDLYDVPGKVFAACDDADIKVNYTAPELMKRISDAAEDAIEGREVSENLLVSVTTEGTIKIRRQSGET
ncbi:Tfx family DNA-binding protein [Haloarculaceae archaeon H-GB2-1]|nr:Tfx family DNA-binding protein [Haloarculaceae archaeon H-GB1-1]MEA5388394.1 Tfx family DNA-binding protein [Haloarculaceae archaeon H-GB11]MEA5406431.1 Tfx family DNA-binding protein [Haloarculaceae archaeon H-GB2-1]